MNNSDTCKVLYSNNLDDSKNVLIESNIGDLNSLPLNSNNNKNHDIKPVLSHGMIHNTTKDSISMLVLIKIVNIIVLTI